MKCLQSIAIGAIWVPLVAVLFLGIFLIPSQAAVWLGFDAVWGLPIGLVIIGAIIGAVTCRTHR